MDVWETFLCLYYFNFAAPWSGDIAFDSQQQRDSVLVRIPHKERGRCLTIWCRLLQEDVGNGSKRQLFIFSPMYMARSLLPNPLQVLIEANKNQPSGPTSVASLTNMVLDNYPELVSIIIIIQNDWQLLEEVVQLCRPYKGVSIKIEYTGYFFD